jgi:hypothetical protein
MPPLSSRMGYQGEAQALREVQDALLEEIA